MDYNFLINEFNRLKWNYIEKITGVEYKPVGIEFDNAKFVWDVIEGTILNDPEVCGLGNETCIFCISCYDFSSHNCSNCPWGEANGYCLERDSLYSKVCNRIHYSGRKTEFTNQFYRDLLKLTKINHDIMEAGNA